MKYSKRYITFTVILVIAFVMKFYVFAMDYSELGEFRGGNLKSEVWNPMIAEEANQTVLTVSIDNKEYSNANYPIYMNNNREIMVPTTMLRDAFDCSSHIYNSVALRVEKHNDVATFTLNEDTALRGEDSVSIKSPMVEKDGTYYVSLNSLSDLLNYNYSYDVASNTFTTADTSESGSIVPVSYDLRNEGRVSKIRNQGSYGTCWGFAAISALESSMMPERNPLFSVDHMTIQNAFNVDQYDGGDYTMGMAYLAAWQGPVYEKDDPYGDEESRDDLSPVYHVQEMQIIDGKDYENIKKAVFMYGGVQSSLYSNLKSVNSNTEYYNKEKSAYCYIGTEKPNHDVVIVGWDDNYPKENFAASLEGDGAFICQNSWGEGFGEDGFFYVSYYDTNIGTHNVVYTSIQPNDNYDRIYQSDLCGWVGKMGYDKEDIYGANVFTAKSDENIKAASFYATGANTNYELYVVRNFEDASSFQNRVKVAEGTVEKAGYYTIDFPAEVGVDKGEQFAIVLYINTPGATHPMAIEYDTGEDKALETVDLDDGEGFISYSGNTFSNVKTKRACNLCIKAFTDER